MSPHRKSHNLLYNLLIEKNKPPQEMVNKRGVPIGPTWLIRTLGQIIGLEINRAEADASLGRLRRLRRCQRGKAGKDQGVASARKCVTKVHLDQSSSRASQRVVFDFAKVVIP